MPPVLAAHVTVVFVGTGGGPTACPHGTSTAGLIAAWDEAKAGSRDAVHRIGLNRDGDGLLLDVVFVAVVLRIIHGSAKDEAAMEFVGGGVQDGVGHVWRPHHRIGVGTDGTDQLAGVPRPRLHHVTNRVHNFEGHRC